MSRLAQTSEALSVVVRQLLENVQQHPQFVNLTGIEQEKISRFALRFDTLLQRRVNVMTLVTLAKLIAHLSHVLDQLEIWDALMLEPPEVFRYRCYACGHETNLYIKTSGAICMRCGARLSLRQDHNDYADDVLSEYSAPKASS